jgi:hypothetical protein
MAINRFSEGSRGHVTAEGAAQGMQARHRTVCQHA